MKKLIYFVITCIVFVSNAFASNETDLNEAVLNEFTTNKNDYFFGLCEYTVASLDDNGHVIEYFTVRKEIDGKRPCLAWVNGQLDALAEKGYCLGQERVQYWDIYEK